MRFSALHFLLLGTALAAPTQDVEHLKSRANSESLIARGAIPLNPRYPAPVPVVPGLKPKPKPKENGPPPALRPGDDTEAPPPRLNTDKKPDESDTPPKDKDNPNAAAKVDKDGNLESPICAAGALGKRAPNCAPAPNRLQVQPNSLWAQNGIEASRQNGFQWRKDMEQAVDQRRPGTIFEPGPNWNPRENRLNENNRYNARTDDLDPEDVDPKMYLQNPRFGDTFSTADGKKWFTNTVKNNDNMDNAFDQWREQYRNALKAHNPGKEREIDEYFNNEVPRGADTEMMEVQIKPHTGGMIVKMSSQGEDDFYRARRVTKLGPPDTRRNYDFNDLPGEVIRPAFGDGSYNGRPHLNWNDQAWAAWVQACARAVPPVDPSSIRAMGRDNIVTTRSMDTIDAVMQQKNLQVGNNPVTFTIKRPRANRDNDPDAAYFDAVVNIPQAKGPVQMAANAQKEAPGLIVDAFTITVVPSNNQRGRNYYMVPEFGIQPQIR